KLATSVFGFAAGLNQPGYVFFGAELDEDMDQEKALRTLQDTLTSLKQEPFTQEELERIRNQWLTDWSQIYANPASLAAALSENVADGDWRLFFLDRDRVEQMQLEDVQRVTTAYLVP